MQTFSINNEKCRKPSSLVYWIELNEFRVSVRIPRVGVGTDTAENCTGYSILGWKWTACWITWFAFTYWVNRILMPFVVQYKESNAYKNEILYNLCSLSKFWLITIQLTFMYLFCYFVTKLISRIFAIKLSTSASVSMANQSIAIFSIALVHTSFSKRYLGNSCSTAAYLLQVAESQRYHWRR